MSIERGGPSEEEMLKWERQRTLSDAKLLQDGAKYKISKNEKGESRPVLEVTEDQIAEAHEEMENALEAPRKARQLLEQINLLSDEQLDSGGGWRQVLNTIRLCREAGMESEARQLSRRIADHRRNQFEKGVKEDPNNFGLVTMAKEWLKYLNDTGDQQAVEVAKARIRELLDPESAEMALNN